MNIAANIINHLEAMGLKDKFQTIVSVEEVKKHKPDPEVLLKSCAKMKLKPEECVVIDDSETGIEAAHKIGMKIISLASEFHEKSKLEKLGADLAITSMKELNLDKIKELDKESRPI